MTLLDEGMNPCQLIRIFKNIHNTLSLSLFASSMAISSKSLQNTNDYEVYKSKSCSPPIILWVKTIFFR